MTLEQTIDLAKQAGLQKWWKSGMANKLTCPYCGAWTEIKQTKPVKDMENTSRRHYVCGNEHKFTTLVSTFERFETVFTTHALTKPKQKESKTHGTQLKLL